MKWLPALRFGMESWLLPLSVPAADVIASFLMQPSLASDSREAPEKSSATSRVRGSGATEIEDEAAAQARLLRLMAVLRADWVLRWYAALLWSDQVKLHGTSERPVPRVALAELACWFAEQLPSLFADHERRLVTDQVAARLGDQILVRWQHLNPRLPRCTADEEIFSEEDERLLRKVFRDECKQVVRMLRWSGPQVPQLWSRRWFEVVDDGEDAPSPDDEARAGGEAARDEDLGGDEDLENLEGLGCEQGVSERGVVAWIPTALGYGESSLDLFQLARVVRDERLWSARFADRLHLAKMASLRQLAYGLSHEINNPLAAIRTRAEMLMRDDARGGLGREEGQRQLQGIVDAAMRAHEMIAELMYFARPPRPFLSRLDAVELTAQMGAESAAAFRERGIEFELQQGSAAIPFIGDASQLCEALRTLLRNALEAVGQGSGEGVVVLGVRGGRRWVRWQVSDSGPGLSREAREHAFDPYYSGREAGRGLGLGLSRVFRIARSHGGGVAIGGGMRGFVDPAVTVGCQVHLWVLRRPDLAPSR